MLMPQHETQGDPKPKAPQGEASSLGRCDSLASTEELGTTIPSYDGGGDFTEGDLNANDA